nr:MAG TPA: Early E3 14.5 kDa protein [Caudoviricetes sp.]
MFYANFLFTSGLTMTLLSVYACQHDNYGTFLMVAGIIVMFIGTVAGLKVEFDAYAEKTFNEEKVKELKRLIEAQTKQIQLLKEEVDILNQR